MDTTIDVLEKFGPVVQGEGYFTGTPSIFIRTFGCNFQCRGFGMPAGELSTEALDIAKLPKVKTLHELPLVSTGCDSYASHMKAFKYLTISHTVDELIDEIFKLVPDEHFTQHLVLTGGETLLRKNQLFYSELLVHADLKQFTHVTFETNGTQELIPELQAAIENTRSYRHYTFSVSAKLSNSGESRKRAIVPAAIVSYQKTGQLVYMKFVVAAPSDVVEIKDTLTEYYNNGVVSLRVYYMPCGGTIEEYHKYKPIVQALADADPDALFSERLHLDLYGNAWST